MNRRNLLLGVAGAAIVAALPAHADAVTMVDGRAVTDGRTYQDFLLDYEKGVVARVSRHWQAHFTETDTPGAFLIDGETFQGSPLTGKLSTPYSFIATYGWPETGAPLILTITPPTDFDLWLLRLDWHFEQVDGLEGVSYVEQTGRECWQAMFDDGMSPEDACREERSCWDPE